MKAERTQRARNLDNEEKGDVPAVRTRDVRRMGTESLGTPMTGYVGISSWSGCGGREVGSASTFA